MLNLITKATFIYFNTQDNEGITRKMLRELNKLSNELDCYFKFDEREARYYIWIDGKVWEKEEVSEIVSKIKDICTGVNIEVIINNIDCGTEDIMGNNTYDNIHRTINNGTSILNEAEINAMLDAMCKV